MKKVFLSIAAVAAMVFTAQAQFSIIPKAGVTLGTFSFKEKPESLKSKLGFVAGAGFNLPVGDGGFSLQPEILYTQKGFAYTESEDGIDVDAKHTWGLIEVPVLAKYTFGEDAFKFYINAGPSFGYVLNGKTKASGGGFDVNVDYEFDSDSDNRLDIGVQAGAGISYEVGPGSIILDARYGYGLTNYIKTPDGGDKADYKSQSRTFAVTVGYSIPLGGK
ncbi:porin family protein [Cytophagaceae bacterium YF14B1]|uniref:Porin family protein n=1 Tax=Xanthocytophaga flava TaxID=3048013 RepID=A0AAE3U537_9BACT|nr:porin family protein [Xanthocytophaga flavus]MDJ1479881.1 porin family protein [Xanthocytophaga flavus]